MILVKFNFFAWETHRGGKKDSYLSESVKAATNTLHNEAIVCLKTNLMTFTIRNFSHVFLSKLLVFNARIYLVKTVTA